MREDSSGSHVELLATSLAVALVESELPGKPVYVHAFAYLADYPFRPACLLKVTHCCFRIGEEFAVFFLAHCYIRVVGFLFHAFSRFGPMEMYVWSRRNAERLYSCFEVLEAYMAEINS